MTKIEGMNKIFKQIDKAVIKGLKKSCMLVASDAKNRAPIGKTSLLGNSIRWEVNEETKKGYVYTLVKYAPYVEYMTRAHIIEPKGKENGGADALAWGKTIGVTKDGTDKKEFVRKKVRHPGTDAQPFMRPALDSNRTNIKKIIINEVNNIFN